MQTQPLSAPVLPPNRIEPPVLPRRRQPLLAESAKKASVLIWVALVPQTVLLLLNLRDYQLVAGEMTARQLGMARLIGGTELALLVGLTALILFLRFTGRAVSWLVSAPLLIAPILYLVLVVSQIFSLLPASVTVWILPPEQVMYDQFVFMMPLIFYAAVRLACADINIAARVEWMITAALGVGIPLVLAAVVYSRFSWLVFRYAPAFLFVSAFIVLTIVTLAAILRALVIGYISVRRQGPVALTILSSVVGIAGPIGGLLLNRTIPFPVDFQSRAVYGLALVNGLLLLLPNFRNPTLHRGIWLAQCLLFPFTFYFFLVFLPFLPLSLPAMLAFGAGFLILTPTALFLVHGQRIYDGYRNEIRDGGRLKPALLGVVAISILPTIYVAEAGLDRVFLRQAIDYVYSPNYRTDSHFEGSLTFVRRSLEHLRDSKAGLDLPFLSRFYNWAVFDGLVLPDDKMNYIHRVFFGNDVPPRSQPKGFFSSPGAQQRSVTRPAAPLPHDVVLRNVSSTLQTEGSCHRATVALQMENLAQVPSEFVTTIELPPGVLVSGFWLHIGTERVPGQVFEKKTALWVYQMIRDRARRDPGLLLYKDPHTLELRVFPFGQREQREVEIEFLYPANLNPTIAVGAQTVRPSGEQPATGIVMTHSGGGSTVWLGSDAVAALPKTPRTPYLHFLVDRSANSDVTTDSLNRAVKAARARFPQAQECVVTGVNYEITDLTQGLQPVEAASTSNLSALPLRGGFMATRAIKRALLRYHDASSEPVVDNPWLNRFPVFVVVAGSRSVELSESDLSSFAKFAPDFPVYLSTKNGSELETYGFSGSSEPVSAVRPVALLKAGQSIEPCPATTNEPQVIDFPTEQNAVDLRVFETASRDFVQVPVNVTIPTGSRYGAGLDAWRDYFDAIHNPSLGAKTFSKTVNRSRETGILVGSTSYIVVESSSQWKMLERKQKQKLRNNSILEFEAASVPEPSTWCLIVFGAGLLSLGAFRKMKAKPTATTESAENI